MEDITDLIKQDKEFRKKLTEDYAEVVNSSTTEQKAMLKIVYPKYRLMEEAVVLAGETIYELSIENEVLKTELEKSNEYDEDKINKLITTKKKDRDVNKNERILNALRKTSLKTKQLL